MFILEEPAIFKENLKQIIQGIPEECYKSIDVVNKTLELIETEIDCEEGKLTYLGQL